MALNDYYIGNINANDTIKICGKTHLPHSNNPALRWKKGAPWANSTRLLNNHLKMESGTSTKGRRGHKVAG